MEERDEGTKVVRMIAGLTGLVKMLTDFVEGLPSKQDR
jgi:hypothetical protein